MMNVRASLFVAMSVIGSITTMSTADAAGLQSGVIEQVEVKSTAEIVVYLQGPTNHECGAKRIEFVSSSTAQAKSFFLASLLSWQAQGKVGRFNIVSCDGTTAMVDAIFNEA